MLPHKVIALVVALLGAAGAGAGRPGGGGGGSPAQLGCVDHDGAPVDWFVLYKLPRLHDMGPDHVADGVGYLHFSSASTGDGWTMSDVAINDSRSAPGRTLAPVYAEPRRKSLLYVFYNDEHPDGPTSYDLGHTKGVVAFDGAAGFWLVHSVPHYPPPPGAQYGYPESGERYGQSFLCLTLAAAAVESVAAQLLFNEPYIFASQLSVPLAAQYPLMSRVVQGERRRQPPWFGVQQLTAGAGGQFFSYAKARPFGKDLYADLAAPALHSALLTETWMNGPRDERIPSECATPYPVNNIRNVSIRAALPAPASGSVTVAFTSTHDHSKWAVSPDAARPWVCVGDINRMTTQEARGGGTVCHSSARLWRLYSQTVDQVEPCPGGRRGRVYTRRP